MKPDNDSQIHKIRSLRKEAQDFFIKRSEVYRAFLRMEELTFRDGALSKKEKELIAIGISVAVNCESCLEWHINQAFRSGATDAEILEAVEVGIEMSGGPGTVASRFAMKVMKSLPEIKTK